MKAESLPDPKVKIPNSLPFVARAVITQLGADWAIETSTPFGGVGEPGLPN